MNAKHFRRTPLPRLRSCVHFLSLCNTNVWKLLYFSSISTETRIEYVSHSVDVVLSVYVPDVAVVCGRCVYIQRWMNVRRIRAIRSATAWISSTTIGATVDPGSQTPVTPSTATVIIPRYTAIMSKQINARSLRTAVTDRSTAGYSYSL